MTNVEIPFVSPEELTGTLRGRMGLIVGPSVTTGPSFYSELSAYLSETFSLDQDENYFNVGDAALDSDRSETEIRSAISTFIRTGSRAPQASILVPQDGTGVP